MPLFPLRLPRLSLSTFYFLLSILAWLTPASAHAESSAYFKSSDSAERSTERLNDFLEELGYMTECSMEGSPSIAVHQQGHNVLMKVRVPQDELTGILAQVHYKFNPKAGTAETRVLVANHINDAEFGIKVCVNESDESFYFEYALHFDNYLRPRLIKTFIDQAIATSHRTVFENKLFKAAFFGDDHEDAPDSGTNTDEADSDSDDEPAMTDEESTQEATAPTPSPSTPAPSAPSAATAPSAPAPSTERPSPPAPTASTANPARPAPSAPSPQSLVPELPPTTPAAPARTKKAKA